MTKFDQISAMSFCLGAHTHTTTPPRKKGRHMIRLCSGNLFTLFMRAEIIQIDTMHHMITTTTTTMDDQDKEGFEGSMKCCAKHIFRYDHHGTTTTIMIPSKPFDIPANL